MDAIHQILARDRAPFQRSRGAAGEDAQRFFAQGPVDEAFGEPDARIRSAGAGAVIAQHGSHGFVMDLHAQRA